MTDLGNHAGQAGRSVMDHATEAEEASPRAMQAYVVRQAGGPEVLREETVAVPEIRPGWSLIRVRAFGINYSEIFTRQGLSPSVRFPRILGIDCAGEIMETTDPDRLPVGRAVISVMGEMGRAFDGSYAQYVLVPNGQIYTVDGPDGGPDDGSGDAAGRRLGWTDLASAAETYYTAFGSLCNLRLEGLEGSHGHEGSESVHSVLVRAASSGVGIAFARLVRAAFPSLRVVGSTRNPAKSGHLLAASYSDVIRDKDGRLETDETFDRALELIGPKTLRDTISHLNPGAIVCSTGQLGGAWYLGDFDPIVDLPADGYLTSFYSGNVSQERIDRMFGFIRTYRVPVTPDRVMGFDQVRAAHELIESGKGAGKIVIRV